MEIEKILNIATEALKEIKAKDITTIDVEHLTQMMRYIVICTATSTTHANALSKNLEATIKKNKIELLGIEGQANSGWILVDLGDVVIHIMLEETRDFYQLEKLWNLPKASE